jgi:hypothetical protein
VQIEKKPSWGPLVMGVYRVCVVVPKSSTRSEHTAHTALYSLMIHRVCAGQEVVVAEVGSDGGQCWCRCCCCLYHWIPW